MFCCSSFSSPQVRGQAVGELVVPVSTLDSEQSLERAVLASEVAQKHVRGQVIKKTIVVLKRKLVNFVL